MSDKNKKPAQSPPKPRPYIPERSEAASNNKPIENRAPQKKK